MKRHESVQILVDELVNFDKNEYPLHGLTSPAHYETFSKQLLDSIRRINYVEAINARKKPYSHLRSEPNSSHFDPLIAAKIYKDQGNYDEACWLIFLSTHFGKSIKTKWKLCRDIYSGLGTKTWTWASITDDFEEFENWFKRETHGLSLKSKERQYGNHRKYETLKDNSRRSIPKVFKSYIDFIGKTNSHTARFAEAESLAKTPEALFELLYSNMNSVTSFGRTAKFDYLTMLRKMDLLNLEPGHLFLSGSTGPIKGCRLLFNNNRGNGDSVAVLNEKLSSLSNILPIGFLRMQVLEDSLCNWQKSPSVYNYFGG